MGWSGRGVWRREWSASATVSCCSNLYRMVSSGSHDWEAKPLQSKYTFLTGARAFWFIILEVCGSNNRGNSEDASSVLPLLGGPNAKNTFFLPPFSLDSGNCWRNASTDCLSLWIPTWIVTGAFFWWLKTVQLATLWSLPSIPTSSFAIGTSWNAVKKHFTQYVVNKKRCREEVWTVEFVPTQLLYGLMKGGSGVSRHAEARCRKTLLGESHEIKSINRCVSQELGVTPGDASRTDCPLYNLLHCPLIHFLYDNDYGQQNIIHNPQLIDWVKTNKNALTFALMLPSSLPSRSDKVVQYAALIDFDVGSGPKGVLQEYLDDLLINLADHLWSYIETRLTVVRWK